MTYGGHFDVSAKKEEIKRLEDLTLNPNFWDNREEATKIIDNTNSLKEIVSKIEDVKKRIDNITKY